MKEYLKKRLRDNVERSQYFVFLSRFRHTITFKVIQSIKNEDYPVCKPIVIGRLFVGICQSIN